MPLFGLRFLLGGLAAVVVGVMIILNPDLGGPVRGSLAIVFGLGLSFIGIRQLLQAARATNEPSVPDETAPPQSDER